MSDETSNPTPAETAAPADAPAPAPTKVNQAISVLATVADQIKGSGQQVREALVTSLVNAEVTSRVQLLQNALTKRTEADREVRKCSKPDVETFDSDGKSLGGVFSKAAVESLKKAREQLDKVDKALEKALGDNDFSKLKELK